MRKTRDFSEKSKHTLCSIYKAARKYKTRKDFERGDLASYTAAHVYKVSDIVTAHMSYVGNLYKRCLYKCEFPDKSIYVGLTSNFDRRMSQRLLDDNDTVTKYAKSSGLNYDMVRITDYIDAIDASEMEGDLVDKYSRDGYNILNIATTGGLGGGKARELKWTYEAIKNEALLYNSIGEFKAKSKAYGRAHSRGILDEVTTHMSSKQRRKPWTYDELKKEALEFNSRSEFRRKCGSAASAADKMGVFQDICKHMEYFGRWKK